ncbi:MAG: TlpA family protein disulfide reductase [Planctomycetes bacterium]|nr:TlpA family protein disulfide reductase [Planctomycetota bacterium]
MIRSHALSIAVLLPVLTLPLYAQQPESSSGQQQTPPPAVVADGPAAAALRKADTAIHDVKAMQYDFNFSALSSNPMMPEFKLKGATKFVRGTDLFDSMIRIKSEMKVPAEVMPEALKDMDTFTLEIVSDGTTANIVDSMQKIHVYAPTNGDGKMLLRQTDVLFMREFLTDNPFGAELAGTLTLQDPQEVNEVACDVIHVDYGDGINKATWYFGRDDQLPRKVERVSSQQNITQTLTLTLAKLDTSVELTKDDFQVVTPDGYRKEEFKAPPQGMRQGPLAVGSVAPLWELKDAEGKAVDLEALKGSIVLLNFWDTSSKQDMQGLEELTEFFKDDKRIAVYCINAWEDDPAKAVEYFKEHEYSCGLLLGGDDVADAYGVSGIPTYYLVGPDGKVLYREIGANPEAEKTLMELIAKELAKLDQ